MPKASALVLGTDREVQHAKARPSGARAEYRIKDARNLVLRVSAVRKARDGADAEPELVASTKVWLFLYRSPQTGKRCKFAFGTYPEMRLAQARDELIGLANLVRRGEDPVHERSVARGAETFAMLARRYIAEHEIRNARGGERSAWTDEAQRLIDADILPEIGAHKAEAVTKEDVRRTVQKVADRGALVTADKVLALIRSIYNWGGSTGRLDRNPTVGLKKRAESRPRERTLAEAEIRSLWQGLEGPGDLSLQVRDVLRLQLLLALRVSEITEAPKAEIDLDQPMWTIPPARTKAGREHRLPLSPWAADILKGWSSGPAKVRGCFHPRSTEWRLRERSRHQNANVAAGYVRLQSGWDAEWGFEL